MISNTMRYLLFSIVLATTLWQCGSESNDDPVADTQAGDSDVSAPLPAALSFSDASARIGTDPLSVLGVALVDFNGDGWPDITLADRDGVRLYRGTGDGFFEVHSSKVAGSDDAAGIAWADVDGDGDLDLFVTTRSGPDHLYFNDGKGSLTDHSIDSGLGNVTYGQGASFGDLDGDGDLDLYVCQGVGADSNGRIPDRGNGTNGHPNRVYRNDGSGTFEDATEEWGLAGIPGGESFMALLYDIDNDNDLDVLVVHDHVEDQLFLNPGNGGSFEDASLQYLPNDPTSIMGMDVCDMDQDGRLDVYGTQAGSDLLYISQENGKYTNSYSALLDGDIDQSALLVGWGTAFIDVDNDGDSDIISTANYPSANASLGEAWSAGQMVLLRNDLSDGPPRLEDVSADAGPAFQRTINGWGLAVGDVDRDGDVDVLVGADSDFSDSLVPPGANVHKTPLLLLNNNDNDKASGLSLLLQQPGHANTFAVGARVTVENAQSRATRVVLSGMSYLSHHSYRQHFGLGDGGRAEVVRVRWPDGFSQMWVGLSAGEHTLNRNEDGNCCVSDGTCSELAEEECRIRGIDHMDLDEMCALACNKLSTCGQLSLADATTVEECENDCKLEAPDEESLPCFAFSPCEELEICLTREEGDRGTEGP
ncbi:MAG TPA: CRTAC1 family protein [Myxococcales bacterium]|nr:CRTAC1 family protein [Myxococcales bacterium]